MIGAPVCRLARATARWIFSTFSVTPGRVGGALQERRLDVGALDAAFDVRRRSGRPSRRRRGCRSSGGGSRSCRCPVHATICTPRLVGHALHEAHVAPAEHRRRVDDRLHAAVLGAPLTATQRRVELELLVVAPGPLRRRPPRRGSARARATSTSPSSLGVDGPCTVCYALPSASSSLAAGRLSEAARPSRSPRAAAPSAACRRGCAAAARSRTRDVLGNLEVGEMRAAVGDHRLRRRARSPARGTITAPTFSPIISSGTADDRRLADARARRRARSRPRSSRRSRRRG